MIEKSIKCPKCGKVIVIRKFASMAEVRRVEQVAIMLHIKNKECEK